MLSLGGGFLFKIPEFLGTLFPTLEAEEDITLMAISTAAGLARHRAGVRDVRRASPGMADSLADSFGGLYKLVYNKYFVDEIYDAAVVKPMVGGSRVVLWKGMDAGLIDGIVNGVGARRARRRRRAAAAAIGQYPQLRHLGAVRLGAGDRRAGHRGRRAMNLLTVVLALPLAGFLVALLIPRNSPQAAGCGR